MSTHKTQQDQQKQQAHQQWIATLSDARKNCREALARGSVYIGDPERALWPVVSANQMSKAHQVAAQIHAAVLDYHEHVEPFQHELMSGRGGIGDTDDRGATLWSERLHTVAITDEDDGTQHIRLGKLQEQWADHQVQISMTVNEGAYGQRQVSKPRRLLLPLSGARKCYRQLNRCVESLNLAVQIDATPLGVSGVEDAATIPEASD